MNAYRDAPEGRAALPSIPPRVARFTPDDPFEIWMTKQAVQGYSRSWLDAHRSALERRWRERPSQDLPPPEPPPERQHDRYGEL
jgi:hypothetical protein